MSAELELSPMRFFEEAKHMLIKKDLLGFVSKISVAIELSRNNEEMLAKSTFLEATGLSNFNQHRKALESISEALKYNDRTEVFTLKKLKGVSKGYLGFMEESLKIFKELITETADINLLVGVYLNISWVHLLLKNPNEYNLEEAKHYLDLANEHFDSLSNRRKLKVLNNYSVYYFYKDEYDKAIELLEDSIKYCEEQYLPDIYNNLSELYLKIAETEDSVVAEVANEYLKKAEILATTNNNNLTLGYIFYTMAMIKLREDQLFTALDTLYLSFEFFKKAEAHIKACDTLLKINELTDDYKHSSLQSFRENLKNKLKNTQYYDKC